MYPSPSSFKRIKLVVVGLGALGSFTTYFLAKHPALDITFHLIDFDIVESKNIYNQLYTQQDVGRYKVKVMKEKVEKVGKKAIEHNVELCEQALPYFGEQLRNVNIIIGTTDNLHSRNLINCLSITLSVPWVYAGITKNKMMLCPCLSKQDKESYRKVFGNKRDARRIINGRLEREVISIEMVSLFSSLLAYRVVEIITKKSSSSRGLEFYTFEKGEVKKEVVRWSNEE